MVLKLALPGISHLAKYIYILYMGLFIKEPMCGRVHFSKSFDIHLNVIFLQRHMYRYRNKSLDRHNETVTPSNNNTSTSHFKMPLALVRFSIIYSHAEPSRRMKKINNSLSIYFLLVYIIIEYNNIIQWVLSTK